MLNLLLLYFSFFRKFTSNLSLFVPCAPLYLLFPLSAVLVLACAATHRVVHTRGMQAWVTFVVLKTRLCAAIASGCCMQLQSRDNAWLM
jgi:hypothetical protein